MKAKLALAVAVLLMVSAAIPVSLFAHHSFAAVFDDSKPLKL